MNYKKVLNKLENEELTPELAYELLYPETKRKPGKRASFIKLRINVPEEGKKVNTFLRLLFLLPIPMVFARLGLKIASRYADIEEEIDLNEVSRLLKYSKNTIVNVDAKDAQVDIRII